MTDQGLPRDPEGRWWTYELSETADGMQLAKVQFASGPNLVIRLTADEDPKVSIPLAAEARIRRDVRWTKRSDRYGAA